MPSKEPKELVTLGFGAADRTASFTLSSVLAVTILASLFSGCGESTDADQFLGTDAGVDFVEPAGGIVDPSTLARDAGAADAGSSDAAASVTSSETTADPPALGRGFQDSKRLPTTYGSSGELAQARRAGDVTLEGIEEPYNQKR